MSWFLLFAAVAGPAYLLYALYQVAVSFTWTAEKTARLRRGPTNSPGETLWLLAAALFVCGLSLAAIV